MHSSKSTAAGRSSSSTSGRSLGLAARWKLLAQGAIAIALWLVATEYVHLPEILYRWRIHGASTGLARQEDVMGASRGVLQRHLDQPDHDTVVVTQDAAAIGARAPQGEVLPFVRGAAPELHGSAVAIDVREAVRFGDDPHDEAVVDKARSSCGGIDLAHLNAGTAIGQPDIETPACMLDRLGQMVSKVIEYSPSTGTPPASTCRADCCRKPGVAARRVA